MEGMTLELMQERVLREWVKGLILIEWLELLMEFVEPGHSLLEGH